LLPASRFEVPMPQHVVLLSIPGLRERDLSSMPNLGRLATGGGYATLVPSFPAVTCPVQANMTTGVRPREHGVVANGFTGAISGGWKCGRPGTTVF
jgi:predicted AlkP superfamily pyrophosphatase or phosphodiesterase